MVNVEGRLFLQSQLSWPYGLGFPCLLQVTALGNPKLLERVSNGVLAIQSLFQQFDTDGNNQVTRDEFAQVGSQAFQY